MTDCASPTAPTPASMVAGLNPVRSWVVSSAASSAAPRSGLVSTYSGITSRSSAGNTTRCSTRRPRPVPAMSLPRGSVTLLPEVAERLVAGEERAEAVFVHGQRGPDRHVHVEVFVGAQAPAEEHAGLAGGHLPVGQQPLPVRRRVDRVVRLVTASGRTRELPHDHRLVRRVPVTLRVEVPELVDTGERNVGVRVVHDGRSLEVASGQDLQLEVGGTPREARPGVP